jgi:hypothetical protein
MAVHTNSALAQRKRADLRDLFKKATKTVCTSNVVSPDHVSFVPSASSAVKTPDNTEEDPDDPEPANEGDIQVEYFSD